MTQETSIDLDSLGTAGEATQRVGVAFDDDGSPTTGFVIVGKDSHQYRDTAQRLRVSGIKRQAVKAQRIDTKTDEGATAFDQLIQRNEEELAVAVVVGWFGFTAGGQPAAFSADNVRKVFKAKPSYREKVSAAMENEAAFLPPLPASSATSPGTSSA
jgi:hypothetical protein